MCMLHSRGEGFAWRRENWWLAGTASKQPGTFDLDGLQTCEHTLIYILLPSSFDRMMDLGLLLDLFLVNNSGVIALLLLLSDSLLNF